MMTRQSMSRTHPEKIVIVDTMLWHASLYEHQAIKVPTVHEHRAITVLTTFEHFRRRTSVDTLSSPSTSF
jgi:hypothetical protein